MNVDNLWTDFRQASEYNRLMIYNKMTAILIHFLLEMTSKVDKVSQKPTFTQTGQQQQLSDTIFIFSSIVTESNT